MQRRDRQVVMVVELVGQSVLLTPGILYAIALRIAAQAIGLSPGIVALLLAHTIHVTPYAAIMVGARLATVPADQVDAARDVGAGPLGSAMWCCHGCARPCSVRAGWQR